MKTHILCLVNVALASCLPVGSFPPRPTVEDEGVILTTAAAARAGAIPDNVVFELCSIEEATGRSIEPEDFAEWLLPRLHTSAQAACGRRPPGIARLWVVKSLKVSGNSAVLVAEVLYGSSHSEELVLRRGGGGRWYLERVILFDFVIV